MTKDDLYNKAKANSSLEFRDSVDVVSVSTLDEFFSQNVCIPKGDNRHPDADELHKWVEDTTLKVYCKNSDGGTYQTFNIKTYPPTVSTYFTCIKPSEPIYEWQCVLIQEGYPNRLSGFMTEVEITDIHEMVTVIKIAQTKQVRS